MTPPGSVLYWEPAGNVIIGDLMDAYGNNTTLIDNLEISAVQNILPIELTSFDAVKEKESVHLTWETSREEDSDKYILERSPNGIDFNSIGVVNSAGESNSIMRYSFIDEEPRLGNSYYRVKHVDIDESVSYSEIKFVNFALNQEANVLTYPNPAQRDLTIQFDKIVSTNLVRLQLYDTQGKLVLDKEKNINYKVNLNLESIDAGTYILRVITSNAVISKKVIKQS